MEKGVVCPNCHKRNDIQKFCIYCGHQLLDDEQIKLMTDNPEPYCLNCGRPVGKGQEKCECGYEVSYVNCPDCNSKNAYTNRFCTECGKKLWTSDVCEINYGELKFPYIFDVFPKELRNTIMHLRYKRGSINFPNDVHNIGENVQQLRLNESRIHNHLNELISRWKIVSPNYCINCLSIIKSEECLCKDCRKTLDGKIHVNRIGNKKYVQPVFDIVRLKWNSKFSEHYPDSLSPTIGESQFEYRERLKWEFAENLSLKSEIEHQITYKIKEEERMIAHKKEIAERKRQQEERRKREAEYMEKYGGGYCSLNCRYCYEEFFDSHGVIVGNFDNYGYSEYYCQLGHSVNFGSFCKYYE